MLNRIAQTNLDLYRQLHRCGYTFENLQRVRDCYGLAMELFSDRFRASGKPFVSHLIGTASVLAEMGERPSLVGAGLLHAVYVSGVFPGDCSTAGDKRQMIRAVAGDEAEELVWGYTYFDWSAKGIECLDEAFDETEAREKDIVLMRLANELDDYLSLGMQFCNEKRENLAVDEESCINLARQLDHPNLANALADNYQEHRQGRWASAFARDEAGSFRIPSDPRPMTGSEHLHAAFVAAIRKIRKQYLSLCS